MFVLCNDFFFTFKILSMLQNAQIMILWMVFKKMPKSIAQLSYICWLLSGFVLTRITTLQKSKVSNNRCGLVQVEVEPCDVWKQQSQDVLVRWEDLKCSNRRRQGMHLVDGWVCWLASRSDVWRTSSKFCTIIGAVPLRCISWCCILDV